MLQLLPPRPLFQCPQRYCYINCTHGKTWCVCKKIRMFSFRAASNCGLPLSGVQLLSERGIKFYILYVRMRACVCIVINIFIIIKWLLFWWCYFILHFSHSFPSARDARCADVVCSARFHRCDCVRFNQIRYKLMRSLYDYAFSAIFPLSLCVWVCFTCSALTEKQMYWHNLFAATNDDGASTIFDD